MEAKHSYSSTPLTEDRKQQDSFQQESNLSRYSSSQSSQTYTSVPSGTGASGQSATSFTENMELHHYQVVFAYQLVIVIFFSVFLFFKSDGVMLVSSSAGHQLISSLGKPYPQISKTSSTLVPGTQSSHTPIPSLSKTILFSPQPTETAPPSSLRVEQMVKIQREARPSDSSEPVNIARCKWNWNKQYMLVMYSMRFQ